MKTVVTEASLNDIDRIDEYLHGTLLATPYHRLQWLLAVAKAYRFGYDYLIAEMDKQIVGVLPLCRFKGLSGRYSFCSLPFCDVGGVVANNDTIKTRLVHYALNLTDQQHASSLELRQRLLIQPSNTEMNNRKVSMLLDLPDSAEILLAGFKSKLRSQINKAEKNGLSFDFSNDKKSIDNFFYVFSRNMHLLGSPTHSRKWFHALRDEYEDDLLVGRVWFEEQIVGSGILLFSGKNVAIPWASTLRDYNRLAPNMLLYWNLLKVACDRGCTQFDFGRSTYGEGTYKFKKQWGAQPVLLDWQMLDQQGVRSEKTGNEGKLRDLVETVWKKLPLPVVNFIGPHLRRHISL